MKDFLVELRAEAAKLVAATDGSPMRAIFDGSASLALYAAFLQETWHYVRFTPRTLLQAGEQSKRLGRHAWLADVFAEKSQEEQGHDEWALADLAALGVPEAAVRATRASAPVDAYNAWTRFTAGGPYPVGYLGVAYTLENLAVQRAGKAADALRKAGGIPNIANAVTYLVGHGEADVGHVAELETALAQLRDPAECDAVVGSAAAVRHMYTAMAANLHEIVAQNRRAA